MKPKVKLVIGIAVIVIAIGMFVSYPFPSAVLILCGLLIIPYTLDKIETKLGRKFTAGQLRIVLGFLIVFFFLGIGAQNKRNANPSKQEVTVTPEYRSTQRDTVAERKAMIQAKADNSQGENYNLSLYIQSQLDDPDSYEHVKTVWLDGGDRIVAYVTFRAKNRFGAKIKTTYEVAMTDDEKLLNVKQLQ